MRQNAAISLDSEELILSRDRVTVRYRFINRSDRDVETLIAFPVPSGIGGYRAMPDWKDLDFRTLVDGKPARLARASMPLSPLPLARAWRRPCPPDGAPRLAGWVRDFF